MNVSALLAFLAPLSLVAVALLAVAEPGLRPRRVLAASRVATLGSLALALLAGLAVFAAGPLQSPVLGIGDLGLGVRLDALSATMFAMVAFVGALVVEFSRNYLDGDDRQGAFLGGLCLTIAAVLLLVIAGNLLQLVAAWIATSLALHRLLVFYADRRGAVASARKKFIVARVGDVCVIGAALLLARAFGTADLGAVLEAARGAAAAGTVPAGVGFAAVLIVIAAALKSAMFPTHGWLLDVMETPTPVSALLHAGLINAGTFLVVRFGDVVMLHAPALQLLMLIGGFTALFASLAMVTQTSVKTSLAYSSAAHMGFMLMLCGLGAHAAAILHLVGHSFYKAHAFLSSGSVVEYLRGLGARQIETASSPLRVLAGLAAALTIFIGLGTLLGAPMAERTASMVLGAILVMSTTHLLTKGVGEVPRVYVIARTAVSAAGVTLAFFVLEAAASWILGSAVAEVPDPGALTLAVTGLVVLAFAAVTLLQTQLPARAKEPAWRTAYVHLKNGLYANALLDRMVGTLR